MADQKDIEAAKAEPTSLREDLMSAIKSALGIEGTANKMKKHKSKVEQAMEDAGV